MGDAAVAPNLPQTVADGGPGCSGDGDKIASARVKRKRGFSSLQLRQVLTCGAVANNKGIKINGTQIERTGVGEEARCLRGGAAPTGCA